MKPSLKANRRLTIALTLSAVAVLGITGIASATSRVFEDSPAVTTPITQTTVGLESPVSTPSSVDPSAPSSSIYADEAEDEYATSSIIDDAAPSSSIYDENEAEDEDEDEYATSSSIDGAAPSSSIDDDEDESDDDSATSSTIEDSTTSSTIDDGSPSNSNKGASRKGSSK